MTIRDDWFVTTPEATIRAESIIRAFRDGRHDDIAATLVTDYDHGATTSAFELLVAFVCMSDRLVTYITEQIPGHDYDAVVRVAASVVAEAHYRSITDTEEES